MKVSVILPVHNGGATLTAAIDSILRQDLEDFELLIIDDASTDDSFALIEGYARRDARVRAFRHANNLGLPATLNEGLELARSELVARMDHDDESLPLRLGMQFRFMSTRPRIAACGSFVYHMGAELRKDRLVTLPVAPEEVARRLPRENCLYHPAMMLRREAVLALGGYRAEFRNSEDYDLWLRLARRHQLANVPVPLLRYRLSVGGQTLARKWEQLYFVRLAQAAHRNPDLPLEVAGERARRQLETEDRAAFLLAVARGNLEELLSLGHLDDADKLVEMFSGEVGPGPAAGLRAAAATARRSAMNGVNR